jgi:hypothetical protein
LFFGHLTVAQASRPASRPSAIEKQTHPFVEPEHLFIIRPKPESARRQAPCVVAIAGAGRYRFLA